MTEPDVSDIREQLVDAFDGADYPVTTPMDLLPALPNGPATTFESGEFSMSMMQIHSTADVDPKERFPYESPEALADDIIDGLQDAGELPE